MININIPKKVNLFFIWFIFLFLPVHTGYLKKIYQKSALKKSMFSQASRKHRTLYKRMFTNFRKFNKKNIMLWWQKLKNKISYTRMLKNKKKQKKILQVSSLQLLPAGESPVLPLNEHVLAYEKKALEEVKSAFNFTDAEWEKITAKIKEIRDENLRYLTSEDPHLEDFSNTHEQLPSHIKRILYDILATFNINPQRIKIKISNIRPDNQRFSFASVNGNNELSINKLIFEKPNSFLKGLIAHEIGHLIQSDPYVSALLFNVLYSKMLPDGNYEAEPIKQSPWQDLAERSFIESNEFIADALIASRNIDIARTLFYLRKFEVPDFREIHEELYSKRRQQKYEENKYRRFSPSNEDSLLNFKNTMEKIWGPDWLSPMHSALKIKEK